MHPWVTTADGRLRLARQDPVPFTSRTADKPDILVDDVRRYQRFFGVGASITGSSAVLLDTLPTDARSRVMRTIFGRGDGAGLSVLRQPIGANDFSIGDHSYDDVPPGQTDPGLRHFTLGTDAERVLPLLREAATLNPSLAVVLSPWSAPAWMKSSGSLVGGTLRPEDEDAYARYLVASVRAYRDAGVPVHGLTVQNEPSFSPPGYAGMTLDVDQQRRLVDDHLAAALAHAGMSLHVWALDDNFGRWRDADALLSDPTTRSHVYGVAFHCYQGGVSALRELRRRHPGTPVAVSECSGGTWSPGFGADLRYEASTLVVRAIRYGASWLSKWNLVLDPRGGPQNGGCPDCRGLLTLDPGTGQVQPTAAYYAWAHVGRFVTPGATVIGSTHRTGSPVRSVAFRNPDGSHVLVAFNTGRAAQRETVQWRRRSFGYRVPPGALATFTW